MMLLGATIIITSFQYCSTNNDRANLEIDRITNVNANQQQRIIDFQQASIEPDKILDVRKLKIKGSIEVLDPKTSGNLTVYYLKGNPLLNNRYYKTLGEAMEDKSVKVYETGTVSELKIDNKSNDYIYINSGDIVKGGKQDRTIRYDVVIAPKAKGVNLASFCVEAGRWQKRGGESVDAFATSKNALSSNKLRLAAKKEKNQSRVWDKVGEIQEEINESVVSNYAADVSYDVKDGTSASSLELTLGNEKLDSIREVKLKEVGIQINEKDNIIGFAYFINGAFYGIDLYNNSHLFIDLKDKLIEAVITEAISQETKDKDFTIDEAVISEMLTGEFNVLQNEELNENTDFVTMNDSEDKSVHAFECSDRGLNDWLHYNVIKELD